MSHSKQSYDQTHAEEKYLNQLGRCPVENDDTWQVSERDTCEYLET